MVKIDIEMVDKVLSDYNRVAHKLVGKEVFNYEDLRFLHIWAALVDLKHWYLLAESDIDQYTFGEFTRRSEYAFEELKRLGFDTTVIEA